MAKNSMQKRRSLVSLYELQMEQFVISLDCSYAECIMFLDYILLLSVHDSIYSVNLTPLKLSKFSISTPSLAIDSDSDHEEE